MLDFGNCNDPSSSPSPYTTNYNRNELLNVKDFKWRSTERNHDIIPSRSDFNKSYFYQNSDLIVRNKKESIINISLAYGGLSNLWGGAALPVNNIDIDTWPIKNIDLQPYYREIAKFMPISGEDDLLSSVFTPEISQTPNFELGQQISDFYADMKKAREDLIDDGIYFGRSKLAIDPSIIADNKDFPYGPIFNAAILIEKMKDNVLFQYIPNVFVERIEETTNLSSTVYFIKDKRIVELKADKIFLASGPIGSTHIIAKSLDLYDTNIILKTNQNVFFPFLRFKRNKNINLNRENNLAQMFLDICNIKTFNRFIHVQIYEYGDYVLEPIRRLLGPLIGIFSFVFKAFLERIIIMQSMLHSDFSDHLEVILRKNDDGRSRLDVRGVKNLKTKRAYLNLTSILFEHIKGFKGFPIKYFMFIDPPGASNHIGCSFPMKQERSDNIFESDLLGRVGNFKNTHIIDSTILPSLPAPTITFTIMANAARIVDKAVKSK